MTELLAAVQARKAAEEDVSLAISRLLRYERQQFALIEVHEALRGLVEALMASSAATRQMARVLAVDENKLVLGAALDDIMPVIIEHMD